MVVTNYMSYIKDSLPSPWNRQRRQTKAKLYDKRDDLSDFLDRSQLLAQNLLKQGYVVPRLKSSLQNFYGRHHYLIDS
jgi:hypothetical protein